MTKAQYESHPNNTFGKGLAKALEILHERVFFEFDQDISDNMQEKRRRERHWQTMLHALADAYPSVWLGREILFVGTYQEACDFRDKFYDPHNARRHDKDLFIQTNTEFHEVSKAWQLKHDRNARCRH